MCLLARTRDAAVVATQSVKLENPMSPRLNIIISSTRPGRVGPVIADWCERFAREHGKFEPVLVDLAEFRLPVYDEPNHPRLRQYTNSHTQAWSQSVDAADAYVFVTPEYNYFAPPALINAIDFVYHEWGCKPAGILSYGGASGGMRAAQMLKLMLTSVRVMPLPDSVAVHNVRAAIDAAGNFTPNELAIGAAKTMLDELFRWAEALKPLRAE
jgi:NAD(P)H-dependent FMN reductase